jgi:hypothetical protein
MHYYIGELGLEPRQTESESVVLPLDDSPLVSIIMLSKNLIFWLRGMELNHLPSGYEPDEIPFLYPALYQLFTPNEYMVGELGFEPRQTESKSVVLPLDDSPPKPFSLANKIS